MACRKISHFVRGFPIQPCLITYTITSQLDCQGFSAVQAIGLHRSVIWIWKVLMGRQSRPTERERHTDKQVMFARVDRFEYDGIFDLFCACFWPYFCEHSLQRVAKSSPEYILGPGMRYV